tara:strand:- start:1198 stop:1581 length:384 start_codon:yes stop_codon:yes gene_type:complete
MSITKELSFDRDGLVPVAVTDCETQRLLVLCYMNKEALEKTLNDGKIHVYRRSRGIVVLKGVESGHVQEVEEIRINCDKNSLEIRVRQHVAACAYGYYSCYFRSWNEKQQDWVVRENKLFDPDSVYS